MLSGMEIGNGNLKISLLQFIDDTIFFFKDEVRDTIIVKAILRCFEMAFGHKVNFYKSSLVGINVDHRKVNSFATLQNYDYYFCVFRVTNRSGCKKNLYLETNY